MGRGKIQWGAFTITGLLDMKRELFAQMGRGKIQSFTVQKGYKTVGRRGWWSRRPQAGEGLEAKQAQTVPRVTWVSVRADLGAGSPWADFVRHHAVVGVHRKHALVPRWPSKCSARWIVVVVNGIACGNRCRKCLG